MRNVAAEPLGESAFIVGVDLRVVAATRHRNVCQATIDELLSPLLGIHVDEHAISSLSLTAVTRHGIAVVEMPILLNIECDRATRIEVDSKVATLLDLLDGPQLTVGNMLLSIRSGELYAVAFTERSLRLAHWQFSIYQNHRKILKLCVISEPCRMVFRENTAKNLAW